jgi:ribose transport system substrate-binding protein
MRSRIWVGLLAATALAVAGCGSSSDEASTSSSSTTASTTSAAGSAGVSAAQAEIDKFYAQPTFEAPGEAFDAKAVAKGKTLLSIPASSTIPFVQTLQDGVKKLAPEVGMTFVDWPNQGQPAQWVQGMNAGIDRKVNAINLMAGINPESLGPQVKKAQAAGIPVIASHLYDVKETPALDAEQVSAPYEQAGRLLASWVVAKTNAKADVLVVKIDEVPSTKPMMAGINSVFEERCGDGCNVETVNVAIADVATRIQPEVRSALTRNPKINYVIALYDSAEAPFVVAAIKQAGASGKVKVVTFNGTPSVLELVKSGDVEMDVGENLEWISYAVLDQSMRIMGGLEPVKDPKLPLRVFDKSNVSEAGDPPTDHDGYGDSYIAGYRELWGLGG